MTTWNSRGAALWPPRIGSAKILSVRQPWAWLIVNGHKPVENRSWNTTVRGPFLIHAGKQFDAAGYYDVLDRGLAPHGMPASPDEYERGGIVGRAELVRVVPAGTPALTPWCDESQFRFVLEEARPEAFRPLVGRLGFFSVPGLILWELPLHDEKVVHQEGEQESGLQRQTD